jgi:fatty acid synthase subunit beta
LIKKLLGDQIFAFAIHWTTATAFPDTATHAIDFGPGGLSGIGPFTARNFEGHGLRAIVVGDKGKGDVELHNARHIKFEDWWAKKYAPRLVRTRFVRNTLNFLYLY